MTITRVNPTNWAIGDSLTTAQANAIDINTTNALDKRAAQTDTLSSVVSLSGAGRIVTTRVTGANANTTYLVSGGNLLIQVTSAAVASYTYTLSNTNAQDGDQIAVFCDTTFNFEITVNSAAAVALFVVGNLSTSDGTYAVFCWSLVTSQWVLQASNQMSRLRAQTFTANGTWTCPPGVTQVLLVGCGGGGGGGAGGGWGSANANTSDGGGAGGGGANLGTINVTVVPGTAYTVTIGAGGAGGVGLAASGADGTDTTFGALATFAGAGGGQGGGATSSAASGGVVVSPGATPTRPGGALQAGYPASQFTYTTANPLNANLVLVPGQGGYGTSKDVYAASARNGASSAYGANVGGAGGANGTTSGASFGGGGGGGGGAGPFGVGGAAGAGGNGANPGTGTNGGNGTNAAANSGAGGGGGGGPGQGTVAEGAVGQGGNGGSGKLIVTWVK